MAKVCFVPVEGALDARLLRSIATTVSIKSIASRIDRLICAPPAGQPASLLPP